MVRALVAQFAYSTVRDPSASAPAKFKASTMVVRMVRFYERTHPRLDARSSRAPLDAQDRSGTLEEVPLDVLLAALPGAPHLAQRGGDAITRADSH